MPSESFFYLTGFFLSFGILVYIYFNFFEAENNGDINPNYLKGLKYLLDEESDKAINLFSDLIEIDDETIQTHLALGVLFRKQGRVDKAIQLHEYILSKDDLPENHYFQTLFELGENYFSAGIYNKAEEIFLKLKDHDDHTEAALNKLIIINEYYGEWKQALLFLEQLDAISDQDLSVNRNHYYCEIAEMYIENDDIQSANNYLLKAQGLHTDSIRSEYIKMLIDLKNLRTDSAIDSFESMVNKGETVGSLTAKSSDLNGIEVPSNLIASSIDELPLIVLAGSQANGRTSIRNAKELRVKESDRISSMIKMMQSFTISVDEFDDGMDIFGGTINGATINSFGDHRIAMTAIIASLVSNGDIVVEDCQNIGTSFPTFITISNNMGMDIQKHD